MIQILRNKTWWNRKLIIVGSSEGGVLAPILATYLPETYQLVIMAGGTGWSMLEEMLFLQEKNLRAQGLEQQSIQAELKIMTDTFNESHSRSFQK